MSLHGIVASRVRAAVCSPVPFGHEVLVAGFHGTSEREEVCVAVDRTTHVVYCDPALFGPLGVDFSATTDPVAAITRYSWATTRQVIGVSAGVMVSSNRSRTRLFVGAQGTAYRG